MSEWIKVNQIVLPEPYALVVVRDRTASMKLGRYSDKCNRWIFQDGIECDIDGTAWYPLPEED